MAIPFDKVQKNVEKTENKLSQGEKNKFLLIANIRNIMNYKAGGDKTINYISEKLLKGLTTELEKKPS